MDPPLDAGWLAQCNTNPLRPTNLNLSGSARG